jgi:crossover junction endodeoxyribonuclease RuvC
MTRYIGIDPSTRTGLVILDKNGELIDSMEITAKGEDPARMIEIIDDVIAQMEDGDFTAIEGFSYGSRGSAVDIQYGIGWGLRMGLHVSDRRYIQVAPAALKKFTGAKGNAKKDELAVHIYKRWGFESKSDNVRDAFVLAHIARMTHFYNRPLAELKGIEHNLTAFQADVIKVILNPPDKKKRGA